MLRMSLKAQTFIRHPGPAIASIIAPFGQKKAVQAGTFYSEGDCSPA